MNQRPEAATQDDVVDLLLAQHQEIRRLFAETESTGGRARAESFDRLRRLLAVHETAEEQVLHAGVESATANTLVGPYAAMLDRSRDVLKAR